MKERFHEERTCLKCGQVYTDRPAHSRVDGSPREALESIGVSVEEQDKILGIIHEQYKPE